MKKNINFLTLVLILFPILNIYQFKIKGLGIGDVVIAFSLFVLIINHPIKKIKYIHLPYIIFTIYAIIISIITLLIHANFSVNDVIIRMTLFIFYTIIISIPNEKDFDINKAIEYYKNIATICSVFVIVQMFCFYVLHIIVLGIIPNIPLNYSINNYNEYYKSYQYLYSYFYRPTSFFLEPAHLAQFLGPALIIVLFNKKNIVCAVLYSIAMLLSTSTNAVIIVSVIWLVYLLYITFTQHTYKKFFYIIGILLLIIALVSIVSKMSSTFSYALDRLKKLSNADNNYGSAYERVLKGYEIWKQLKFPEKIFGIGFGTYDSYYSMGTINVFNGEVEYMSSFFGILVNGGIFGFLIFIYSIYNYVKNKDFFNYILAIYLFVIFLSSSVFNTPIYAIIILMLKKTKVLNIKKVKGLEK